MAVKTATIAERPQDLIAPSKAAKLALASLETMYRWIRAGKLRAWNRVGRTFVSKADVEKLFEVVDAGDAGAA